VYIDFLPSRQHVYTERPTSQPRLVAAPCVRFYNITKNPEQAVNLKIPRQRSRKHDPLELLNAARHDNFGCKLHE
jgi:hypothetical protein